MKLLSGILTVVVSISLVTPVSADVAYSNLGPGDSFSSSAFIIGNFDITRPNIHDAFPFTASSGGTLLSIDVAVLGETIAVHLDSMEFNLWPDENSLPGVLLWTGTVDPNFDPSVVEIHAGVNAPTIDSGVSYWLSSRAANGINQYSWYANDQVAETIVQFDNTGGSNWRRSEADYSAFRVNVGIIPEPSSVVLFAIGITLLSRRGIKGA